MDWKGWEGHPYDYKSESTATKGHCKPPAFPITNARGLTHVIKPDAHDAGIGGVNCLNLVFVQRACREMVVVLLPPLLAVVAHHGPTAQQPLWRCPVRTHVPDTVMIHSGGTRRKAGSFYYKNKILLNACGPKKGPNLLKPNCSQIILNSRKCLIYNRLSWIHFLLFLEETHLEASSSLNSMCLCIVAQSCPTL